MTQPSILDYGFPSSSLLWPSRASPIVCVTDSLEVLIQLVYELRNGTPSNIAASKICLRRYRDRCGPLATSNISEKSTIRLHPKSSAILFLATFTQVVKIFGFHGVGWAKVFVAIYLLSYLIQAGIEVLAQNSATSSVETNPPAVEPVPPTYNAHYVKTKSWVAFSSLMASFDFCSWAIHGVLMSNYKEDPNRKAREMDSDISKVSDMYGYTFLGYFIFFGSVTALQLRLAITVVNVYSPLIALVWWATREADDVVRIWRRDINWWIVSPMLLMVFPGVYIFGIYAGAIFMWWLDDVGHLVWLIDGAGMILFTLGSIWLALWMIRLACDRWIKLEILEIWRLRFNSPFFLVLSAVMHLAAACLYFRFVYDPTGTVKPGWTEKLG